MKEILRRLHRQGYLTIENVEMILEFDTSNCDFGIQAAEDGRVWICINGIAFLRFRPFQDTHGQPVGNVQLEFPSQNPTTYPRRKDLSEWTESRTPSEIRAVNKTKGKKKMDELMEEYNPDTHLWCSVCHEAIQPENYFTVKIYSVVARMETSYNTCRECASNETLHLPSERLVLEAM